MTESVKGLRKVQANVEDANSLGESGGGNWN